MEHRAPSTFSFVVRKFGPATLPESERAKDDTKVGVPLIAADTVLLSPAGNHLDRVILFSPVGRPCLQ